MAAGRQSLSLSASLPDVSCVVSHPSSRIQENVLIPSVFSSPTQTPAANYDIHDDRWADKVDSTSGSVFFVDPPSRRSHHHFDLYPRPPSASSCSSFSSITSFPDLPPPPSPTVSLQSTSLPEKLSRSLILTPDPVAVDQQIHYPQTATIPSKKMSSLKKIKKALGEGTRKIKKRSSRSTSDLDELVSLPHIQYLPSFSESESTGSPTSTLTIPKTTLYGSQSLSLQPTYYTPTPTRAHKSSTMVQIRLDISQFGLGSNKVPCSLERLGIVPSRSLTKGKFGSTYSLLHAKSSHPPPPEMTNSLLIRGVVPGSPAAVTQQIFSGDTICTVNGCAVHLENIDTVLAGSSEQVLFVVRKGHYRPHSSLSQYSTTCHLSPGGLVRLVSGTKEVIKSHLQMAHQDTHLLLYLTLDTKEDDPPGKDILYQFPKVENEAYPNTVDSVVQIRGLFLTLGDLLFGITSSRSFCSTVLLNGTLIHLAYLKYGNELLLVALPENVVSPYQIKLLVERVAQTLQLLYGSVHKAFTDSSIHSSSLDHLFSLLFDSVSSSQASTSLSLDMSLPALMAVPQLKLPTNLKVRLSLALNGLDAADHTNRPEILHIMRPFLLIGSCLFLKGTLACSHLCDSDLQDVVQFCTAFRLPELTARESICQIVIWKELYLSRCRCPISKSNISVSSTTITHQHTERHFILIVGLEHVFICMLMKLTHPFYDHTPPIVDAVYVDKARSLILEMKAEQLFDDCEEKGFPSMPLPSLASADVILASLFTRRSSLSFAPLLPTFAQGRKLSEPSVRSGVGHKRRTILRQDSSDSDDPAFKMTTESPSENRRRTQSLLSPKHHPKSKHRERASQSQSVLPLLKGAPHKPYMLTAGGDNVLLHYVHLTCGRGMMVCPAYPAPPGPVQSELIRVFQETVLTIREALYGQLEDGLSRVDSDSDSDNWSSDDNEDTRDEETASPFAPRVSSVIEHGVLFQCGIHSLEKTGNVPTLSYWVVGRLFQDRGTPSELYVCYQDNMSQDSVEMAYRLLFGWS